MYFYEPDYLDYYDYFEFVNPRVGCSIDVKTYNIYRCSQCKSEIFVHTFTERFGSNRGDEPYTKSEAVHSMFLSLVKTGGIILVNTNDMCDVCSKNPYIARCPQCGMKFCWSCLEELPAAGFFSAKKKCPKCESKVDF